MSQRLRLPSTSEEEPLGGSWSGFVAPMNPGPYTLLGRPVGRASTWCSKVGIIAGGLAISVGAALISVTWRPQGLLAAVTPGSRGTGPVQLDVTPAANGVGAASPPGMPKNSCANYGCKSGYVPAHSCQCNDLCVHFNNCCADRKAVCMFVSALATEAAAPLPAQPPVSRPTLLHSAQASMPPASPSTTPASTPATVVRPAVASPTPTVSGAEAAVPGRRPTALASDASAAPAIEALPPSGQPGRPTPTAETAPEAPVAIVADASPGAPLAGPPPASAVPAPGPPVVATAAPIPLPLPSHRAAAPSTQLPGTPLPLPPVAAATLPPLPKLLVPGEETSTTTLTTSTTPATSSTTTLTTTITTSATISTTATKTATTTATTTTATPTTTVTTTNRAMRPLPTLLCIAVVRIDGYEPALVRAQYANKASIFECDENMIFSTGGVIQVGPVTTTLVPSPQAEMGDLHDEGTTTDSWLNTLVFMKVWDLVVASNRWWEHDWSVKIDPDAVFFPHRLRRELWEDTPSLGGPPRWVADCDRTWGHEKPSLKLFGSMEVFSRDAIGSYKAFHQRCEEELDWKGWGEDFFMQNCMNLMGVKVLNGTRLLGDKRCHAAPCTDITKVAFHDFKDVQPYFDCWGQSRQAETIHNTQLQIHHV